MKRTLKEYRSLKHLSQQELSDLSGVSIRTIQRMEKDPSAISPYVMKSLCKALEIEIDQLEIHDAGELPSHEEQHPENNSLAIGKTKCKRTLKYINFSGMVILLFPFSNLVVPPILYWVHRKSLIHQPDKKAALRILSFQILWSLVTLFLIIFIPVSIQFLFGMEDILDVPLFVWIYLMLVAVHIVISLDTAIKLNQSARILTYIPNIL